MILRIKNISDNMDGKVLIRSKQSESDTLYSFQLLFFDKEFDLYPNHSVDFESIDSAKQFAAEIYENENIEWQEITLNQLRQEFFTHILKSFLSMLVRVWNGVLYLKDRIILLWGEKIAKFIPYTKQYRNRSFWKKIQLMREKLSKFHRIESISIEQKKKLQNILLRKEDPVISNEVIFWQVSEIAVAFLVIILIFLFGGGSVILANNLLHVKWGFVVGVISFFTIYLFGIWFILAENISTFLGKFLDTTLLSKINVIVTLLFLLGYPFAFYFYSDSIRFYSQNIWISGLLLGGLNFCIAYSVIFFPMIFFDTLNDSSESRLKTLYPEIMFVNTAIDVVLIIQENVKNKAGINRKQFLLSTLEKMAIHLEKNSLYRIRYQDNATKIWAKTEVKKMSSALRELKKDVIFPDHQSMTALQDKMSHLLIAALTGAWGEFPKIENPQEPSFLQNFGFVFSSIIRTLISAILPALIWIAFQKSPFSIASPISDYVNVGLLLWGILSILAALDPSFSMKINSLKDLTQIISPKK